MVAVAHVEVSRDRVWSIDELALEASGENLLTDVPVSELLVEVYVQLPLEESQSTPSTCNAVTVDSKRVRILITTVL